MTTTLQQALLKAGLTATKRFPETKKEKPLVRKSQEERTPSRPVSAPATPTPKKIHEHHIRTDCESCRRTGPDVEHYEHSNRLLLVKWLCVKCADSHNIPDQTRQTRQSQFARSGLFRREYGATKIF